MNRHVQLIAWYRNLFLLITRGNVFLYINIVIRRRWQNVNKLHCTFTLWIVLFMHLQMKDIWWKMCKIFALFLRKMERFSWCENDVFWSFLEPSKFCLKILCFWRQHRTWNLYSNLWGFLSFFLSFCCEKYIDLKIFAKNR